MKYKEFHKLITSQGWEKVRSRGSHVIYGKPGCNNTIPVPYHGSKEIPEGLRMAISKQMGLK